MIDLFGIIELQKTLDALQSVKLIKYEFSETFKKAYPEVFIKDNTMEEKTGFKKLWDESNPKKTIIGYKFKPGFEKYQEPARQIAQISGWLTFGKFLFPPKSSVSTLLLEAGILDSWFDPVFKEEKRESLFVTEDGKSVSLKDEIWYVANDFKVYFYGPCDFINNVAELKYYPKLYKYFSTESAAKQYIHDNEKVFSRQDVKNAGANISLGEYVNTYPGVYIIIRKSILGL